MKVSNFLPALLLAAMIAAAPAQAQVNKREQRKLDRTENYLLDKLNSKPEKEAKKEAKRLQKQGFEVFPGSLPMVMQLQSCWIKQLEPTEKGTQRYIFSDGNGVGKTQTAAEMQAMEAAKLQLAGQISNEVNQIIESKIANDQMDRESGNSLTKFVAGGKNYIIQSLDYVKPAFKVYRNVGERDMEVVVKLFYNAEEAFEAAQKALELKARKELEKEADELIKEIDKIFHDKRSGS